MHLTYATSLVVTALLASIVLATARGDRIFPLLALLSSGLQTLIPFDAITFSVRSFRIDVVLPALLLLAGAVCWFRLSTKGQVTAATLVSAVGLLQVLSAVGAFSR